jgi:hypothetical protein
MKTQMAKAITKKVMELHKDQMKQADIQGFHHPILYESSGKIHELIKEFERITGKDWDKHAEEYL